MKFFTLFTAATLLYSSHVYADIFTQTFGDETPPAGEIIVERPMVLTGSYKQRRAANGGLASVDYEKFYPVDYASQFPNNGYVEDIIGDNPISIVGIELGYKHNFQLGSMALMVGYSRGSSSAKDQGTPTESMLTVSRTSISANYAIDNFMEEPFVVPYIQGGIYNMTIAERLGDLNESRESGFALNYRLGLLFQLDWIEKSIDPSTQIDGRRSSGLQNTFLDLYYIDHLASQNAADPSELPSADSAINTRSGGQVGIGLKIEF